jgi:hypothetical protein
MLDGRTFHPVPIVVGSGLSMVGSAAPVAAALLSLIAFVLLAIGCWRVVQQLGIDQPAPALAAALVLASPLLPILAFVAYNNVLFATLVVWAIVFELDGRELAPWLALIVAGLVRPEGWVYLVSYGGLTLSRRGEADSKGPHVLVVVGLVVAAPLLWLGLEWWLLGDPLYSFRHVSTMGHHAANAGPGRLTHDLADGISWQVICCAGIGGVAVAARSRRETGSFFIMAAGAPASIAILLVLRFPLPPRHLSALASFIIILAAAGATAPACWIRRKRPRAPQWLVTVLSTAGAAGLIWLAVPPLLRSLPYYERAFDTENAIASALAAQAAGAVPRVAHWAPARGSVSLLGANAMPEVAWVFGIPLVDVSDRVTASTRLLVEPSRVTWSKLYLLGLTSRPFIRPGPAWQLVGRGAAWKIYRPIASRGLEASRPG